MSKAGASNTRILDAALAYAKIGWRVHPLKPSDKVPLLKSWPTKATTDERTIRQWWGKWSDANIGIATGEASNLVVIDSDDYKPNEKTLDDLEAAYGELPHTAMCLTGGGGRQFFFVYSLPCGASQLFSARRCERGRAW